MGNYKSIFKINGKVGDYVFYELNGKPVVRMKAKNKKGPKSSAQKENEKKNREFALVSKAGKYFREALADECQLLGDRYFYQRINKLFLTIKNCDTAPEGSRTVAGGLATEEGAKIFGTFRFAPKRKRSCALSGVTVNGADVNLVISGTSLQTFQIVELQMDFSSGKFRIHTHDFDLKTPAATLQFTRNFRSRMDYMEIWLLKEEVLVNGVVEKKTLCAL